jgi:hypothetical protein
MAKVTIAGGTGFIGQKLEKLLISKGHQVSILTRSPKKENHVEWNIEKGTIDFDPIRDTEILINLCGAGIGDQRWTEARKEELLKSRTEPTQLLFKYFHDSNTLKQYFTASGINCYPLSTDTIFKESDNFGDDFVSDLVRKWEISASSFEKTCKVYKIRLGVVLHPEFGALPKLMNITKYGLASPVGTGIQQFSAVHYLDAIQFFNHLIENFEIESGAYNLCGENVSNAEFMKFLATAMKKPFFMPKVPSFILKLLLGEMSILLLNGIAASNEKVKKTGFEFSFESQVESLRDLV